MFANKLTFMLTHLFLINKFSSQSVLVKFPPNIVNIHVKHPPEASVQIHQVSRIDGPTGQKVKDAQPGQSQISYQGHPVQKTQTVHSTYSHQQVIPPSILTLFLSPSTDYLLDYKN